MIPLNAFKYDPQLFMHMLKKGANLLAMIILFDIYPVPTEKKNDDFSVIRCFNIFPNAKMMHYRHFHILIQNRFGLLLSIDNENYNWQKHSQIQINITIFLHSVTILKNFYNEFMNLDQIQILYVFCHKII